MIEEIIKEFIKVMETQFALSISEIITLIVLMINTLALIFVICQTCLSKKSLHATKQSIDEAKRSRQLEVLPKFTWVIHVQGDLERWYKDLSNKKKQLEEAISINDVNALERISKESPRDPSEVGLSRFLYNNMPSWIREIWISGAQYYYDAASPLSFLWKDGKANFHYAEKWIQERGRESIEAISTLLDYLHDMVPLVILNTPAGIDEENFLRD